MDLSWDWLRPVMRVPYVPTLGPVHPDALTPKLVADVLALAGTARFLPHDTDRRRSAVKDERVLLQDVEHGPERTVIPTVNSWGRGVVKVHYYGPGDMPVPFEELQKLARTLAAREDVERARIVWCELDRPTPGPGVEVSRIQLKTFRPGADPAVTGVEDLSELPKRVQDRFAVFAEQTAAAGFAFLWRRFQADDLTGPILTVVAGDRVVGAIGPMETMKDPIGGVRLLPQHLAVLPEHRGQGHGRTLWRAAMHWGQGERADYQLQQTEPGSAADSLCASEGLTTLGFVLTAPA